MEASIVREILKKNEDVLKRHLILSKTVLDKLHSNGLITDVIRRKILVSLNVIARLFLLTMSHLSQYRQ